MSNRITLLGPRPREGENIVSLRLGRRIALDIDFQKGPIPLLPAYNGINIPTTRSMKDVADITDETLSKLCIHVYDATTLRNRMHKL